MYSNRKISIIWGILLISGIAFGILNSIPPLERPNYLTTLSAMEAQVLIAVFFQALMAIVYLWIVVLLHPIIKKYNKNLASAYYGLRIIGVAFLFVGIASLLLLLWLSQTFVSANQVDLSYFHTLGELLRRGRDHLNHIGMILPWSLGGLILYYSLLKLKIIPSWLSIWGVLGSALTLLATFLLMLTIIEMATPIYFIMNIPAALMEIVLAVFLIVKGIKPVGQNLHVQP